MFKILRLVFNNLHVRRNTIAEKNECLFYFYYSKKLKFYIVYRASFVIKYIPYYTFLKNIKKNIIDIKYTVNQPDSNNFFLLTLWKKMYFEILKVKNARTSSLTTYNFKKKLKLPFSIIT